MFRRAYGLGSTYTRVGIVNNTLASGWGAELHTNVRHSADALCHLFVNCVVRVSLVG